MESFASDLSHQVLQARRRRGELSLPQQDFSRELPNLIAQRPCLKFWQTGEAELFSEDGTDREIVPISGSYRTKRK